LLWWAGVCAILAIATFLAAAPCELLNEAES
jgi:hypothetical protein